MLPSVRIGGIEISTFLILLVLGTVGMLICAIFRRKKYGLSVVASCALIALLTLTGVVGSKLLFAIESGMSSWAGVSFFGSVFLIPLIMPLIGMAFKLNFKQTMDICAPCVAVMIACLRISCFLTGCCGGWQVSWGSISFCWPTQIVESIIDVAILIGLLRMDEKSDHDGELYPSFMVAYGVVRFVLEFFRNTPKDWALMSHGQWFSLCAIVSGLLWILGARKKQIK